jgi:sulfatase maturation enzyme AslB (radical SAM superfamily)
MSAKEPGSTTNGAASPFITVAHGRTLPMTVSAYEAVRGGAAAVGLKSVCNAPFVSLDFGTRGAVKVCNHIYSDLATMTPETGILDIWNGPVVGRLREDFKQFRLAEGCVHCIHQIETGHARETFAQQHFDQHAAAEDPPYPKRLIFRLNSTCNLACIMCDGETSSRVRKERDHLPAYPSAYGEPFFRDMERILPHIEYVEFYGGEPFLVAEHLRIMEMMVRMQCKARVFANTNCVAFSPNARRFVEELNFHTVAVSMDAYHAEVHEAVRVGIDHEQFITNLEWLMGVGRRRGFSVYLNVTEHRKNWFDLPPLFRYADSKHLPIHVNHCISPDNVTLYNLADDELAYVLEYWQTEYDRNYKHKPDGLNRIAYSHLMSLVSGELRRRAAGGSALAGRLNLQCDSKLAVPIPGLSPFDKAQRVRAEIARIGRLRTSTAIPMLTSLADRIERHAQTVRRRRKWLRTRDLCSSTLEGLVAAAGGEPRPRSEMTQGSRGRSEPFGVPVHD